MDAPQAQIPYQIARPRVIESRIFGASGNGQVVFQTYTVSGGVMTFTPFADTAWQRISDSFCNGVRVAPFQSVAGTDTFTGALILRLRTTNMQGRSNADTFHVIPTSGVPSLIPLFCPVFMFTLYALEADQTQIATVSFF